MKKIDFKTREQPVAFSSATTAVCLFESVPVERKSKDTIRLKLRQHKKKIDFKNLTLQYPY
jgi:hypothetical protein